MGSHAELLDEEVDFPEHREGIDELETDVEKPAEKHREDECKYLIVGYRATEHAY